MFKTAMQDAVLIGFVALLMTGCGQQVAETPQGDVNLLATGPDSEALVAPPDYISEVLEASGGLTLWKQQPRLRASGVVRLYRPDGSFYLTEHEVEVYPWSNAIRIEADEPRARFVWQLTEGRYQVLEGNAPLDVSPLAGSYGAYADAVLQIVTAPVRLLDDEVELYREPTPVRMEGVWYQRITAKYGQPGTVLKPGDASTTTDWTDGIYFWNRAAGLVDMIWLGNAATREYLLVRGYDYTPEREGGLRVPSKVEVFRADAEGNAQERLAQLDVSGR
jgi:hypothetical protein